MSERFQVTLTLEINDTLNGLSFKQAVDLGGPLSQRQSLESDLALGANHLANRVRRDEHWGRVLPEKLMKGDWR